MLSILAYPDPTEFIIPENLVFECYKTLFKNVNQKEEIGEDILKFNCSGLFIYCHKSILLSQCKNLVDHTNYIDTEQNIFKKILQYYVCGSTKSSKKYQEFASAWSNYIPHDKHGLIHSLKMIISDINTDNALSIYNVIEKLGEEESLKEMKILLRRYIALNISEICTKNCNKQNNS